MKGYRRREGNYLKNYFLFFCSLNCFAGKVMNLDASGSGIQQIERRVPTKIHASLFRCPPCAPGAMSGQGHQRSSNSTTAQMAAPTNTP